MIDQTTAIFVIVDDVLKAMKRHEDRRRVMSDAEVITTALAGALFFGGNLERARAALHQTGMIPTMLSKSRFCRRLHVLATMLERVFLRLGLVLKQASASTRYLIDSFPVAVCDNIRIGRCRLASSEAFRGKLAPASGAFSTACASTWSPPRQAC
jgi:hypothetical protein